MIDTTYLTDEEKEELEAWKQRWKDLDEGMLQLKKLRRIRIKTEIDCKLSHTTVSKTGKVYFYPSKEISLDQLTESEYLKFATSPDILQQLEENEDNSSQNKLYQKLYAAMASLSQEDRAFITELIVNGKTEQEMAIKMGVYQQKINRRKNAILRKLKKFF